MNEEIGVKLIEIPNFPGIAAGPVVRFPSTEPERNRVAAEAGEVARLLEGVSAGQLALFRHLARMSPEGGYVIKASSWIDTIMKATQGLIEADIDHLLTFDWTERPISPDELRRDLLAVLRAKSPDQS
jgi:hypothetical protein